MIKYIFGNKTPRSGHRNNNDFVRFNPKSFANQIFNFSSSSKDECSVNFSKIIYLPDDLDFFTAYSFFRLTMF